MKNRQNGFAAVEILLVILVVAVLGFGGYYVWNNTKNKETADTPTTSSVKAAETKPAEKQESPSLTIAELGIKLPLTDDISDLTYTWDSRSTVAVVGSPSIMKAAVQDDPTDCSARTEKAYPIARITSDKNYAVGTTVEQKTIADKTYYWSLPGAGSGCNTNPSTKEFSARLTAYYNSVLVSFKNATSGN